jgi:glutaredoxin
LRAAVKVSLLYFDGCPHCNVADQRLREALASVGQRYADVRYRRVSTPEEAVAAQFRGSPTILVNGHDPFLDRASPVGLSCRLYRTPDGLAGSPTVEQLVEVLR